MVVSNYIVESLDKRVAICRDCHFKERGIFVSHTKAWLIIAKLFELLGVASTSPFAVPVLKFFFLSIQIIQIERAAEDDFGISYINNKKLEMALVKAQSHFRSCQDDATDVREANSGLQRAAKDSARSARLVTGTTFAAAAALIALCCKSISFQFSSNAGLFYPYQSHSINCSTLIT